MPTVSESRFFLKYLKFWSDVFVFPFEVNLLSGRLDNLSPLKMKLWKFLYALSVIHATYTFTHTLAMYLFYRERVVLYHLPVAFCGAIAPGFFHLSFKSSLLGNPQAIKRVFNELFDNEEIRNAPRKWKDLSAAEFLGIYGLTGMIVCTYSEYLIIIFFESSMSHLIINIDPIKQFRCNGGFVVAAYVCEAYFLAMSLIHCGFFLSLNYLVVSKVNHTSENIRENLRRWRSTTHIRNSLIAVSRNQLYVQTFNLFNAWFLHGCKTVIIMAAIVEGFIGLRCHSQPLVVVFCICCHFFCIVSYCCLFQIGYSAVVEQHKTNRAILVSSKRIPHGRVRHEALVTLRSLHSVGIKVGEFHEIERNSPIIFIDYVERHVVALLLTF